MLLPRFQKLLLLISSAAFALTAQTVVSGDDTVLKQIIVFSRHGVRSSAIPDSTLAVFASRPYPAFSVPTGYLTSNGRQAELLMGAYFRNYLLNQGLLTGSDADDVKSAYFRANSIQRSNISAGARGAALFPGVSNDLVHSYPLGQPDAVFDPISAKVGTVDTDRVLREVQGVFGSGAAVKSAYSGEFSLIRSLAFNYPYGTTPAPAAPTGLVDLAATPVPLTINTTLATSGVINSGALVSALSAADPFVMQYTDGFALKDVGWGQLSVDQLSQQTRIITGYFSLELTGSPYLNHVQSSNAASHVLRTMEQTVENYQAPGAFGNGTRVAIISSSDAYVVGLAGLLRAHWALPGYQPDYCPPGGSLVFELRQSQSTFQYLVRVYFTAQTFDQLRNLTPLTMDSPPATMQLTIPGGNRQGASLDIPFRVFQQLLQKAIDPNFVENPATENPPAVLTGVPLK